MYPKVLVGTATRYIAGRNAVKTIYWKTSNAPNSKMLKVSKTFNFGKATKGNAAPPVQLRSGQAIKFN